MSKSSRALRGPRPARHPACTTALLLAAVLGVVGCIEPTPQVWWAPDGGVAVVAGDGLRFMTPEGLVSEPVLPGPISGVSWLPDGTGIVVARRVDVPTWKEAAAMLPADEVEIVERIAAAIPAVVGAAATPAVRTAIEDEKISGSDFNPVPISSSVIGLAEVFAPALRERHPVESWVALKALLGPRGNDGDNGDGTAAGDSGKPVPDAYGGDDVVKPAEDASAAAGSETPARDELAAVWAHVNQAEVSVWELAFMPIANAAAAGPPRPLLRTLRPLSCPAVSPRGDLVVVRAVADMRSLYRYELFEPDAPPLLRHRLVATRLEGHEPVEIATDLVSTPVWLSDGRTLAYVTAAGPDAGRFGAQVLQRRSINIPAAGAHHLAAPVPLVLGLFPTGVAGASLAALPRDRLLVSAVQATLPARPDADAVRPRLFVVDATGTTGPELVPAAPDALPDILLSFTVSPDGATAAVVERGSDAVVVVDLATGRVEQVAAKHGGWRCGLLPAWRNDHELVIETLPAADAEQSAWAVWRRGEPLRWLGGDWNAELSRALLRNGKDQAGPQD